MKNFFTAVKESLAAVRADLVAALGTLQVTIDPKADEKTLLASLVKFATDAKTDLTAVRTQLVDALKALGQTPADNTSLKDLVAAFPTKPAAGTPDAAALQAEVNRLTGLNATLTTDLQAAVAKTEDRATAIAEELITAAGFDPLTLKGKEQPGSQAGDPVAAFRAEKDEVKRAAIFKSHEKEILK